MEKELLDIDSDGIDKIHSTIELFIKDSRRLKFQNQMLSREGLVGVFNGLFGHVLKYPTDVEWFSSTYRMDFSKYPTRIKAAYEFVESVIRKSSIFDSPPWPRKKLCRVYSTSMIREVIARSIVSEIQLTQVDELERLIEEWTETINAEKSILFRDSIESRAEELCDFFFRGCRDDGKVLAENYALFEVKRFIQHTSLWEFPPAPCKRNEIEFTSDYMKRVIIPVLQDELVAAGIMHLSVYFTRRKMQRADFLNQLISSCVEPLIQRLVGLDGLDALGSNSHPLLRDGLDEIMLVYRKDLRSRIVSIIQESEYYREVGIRDPFAWRDDISDSYSIVDSDSESQIDFNNDDEMSEHGSNDEGMISEIGKDDVSDYPTSYYLGCDVGT
jgi:hypothetical protein